ncbi:MAG: PhoU domain-containing protein [Candidatus Poseidoniia archaeon]|nr:PhoU domain-containing protein [Candidatus Poseidoniia archaeon]
MGIEMGHTVMESLEMALSSLINRDIGLANEAIIRRGILKEEEAAFTSILFKLTADFHPTLASSIRSIGWNIAWIGEYGSNIAEIAINRFLESPTKICRADPSPSDSHI